MYIVIYNIVTNHSRLHNTTAQERAVNVAKEKKMHSILLRHALRGKENGRSSADSLPYHLRKNRYVPYHI